MPRSDPRAEKILEWRRRGYGPVARINRRDRRLGMKDRVWNGLMKALRDEAIKMEKEGKRDEALAFRRTYLYKGDDIAHPAPTFAEQAQKAGGRVVRI